MEILKQTDSGFPVADLNMFTEPHRFFERQARMRVLTLEQC